MNEGHCHIVRLASFSIMEEIILSKVKCSNISEVMPSNWQQANCLFSAAFTTDRRHVKSSTSHAFLLSLNEFAVVKSMQLL